MRYNELKINNPNLKDIENLFNTEGITMVRLGVKDNSYAQKIKFIKSARLEGNGKYNIRKHRKVIKRNLSKEQAIIELSTKIPNGIVCGIAKPILTKRNYTVKELLQAIKDIK